MYAMYDVICSTVIGGVVLSMLMGFNTQIVEQAGAQTIKTMAQSNLTTTSEIVEFEFRKLGYGVLIRADSCIISADSNKIKFKCDLDNDGLMDTLKYEFNTTSPSGQVNKNTRVLYRTLNSGTAQPINIGLTKFKISYYDSTGTLFSSYPVSLPSHINLLKIAMNIESTVPYVPLEEKYMKNPGVYWERSFKPMNLR